MKKIVCISLHLFVFNSFANDKTTNGTWCDEVGDATSRSQQNYRYISCKRQIYKLKESPEGAGRAGELESMLTSHMTEKGLEFKEAEEVLKSNFFTRGRAFKNKKDIASLNKKSDDIKKLAEENKILGKKNKQNFEEFKAASEKEREVIKESIETNLAKIEQNDEKIKKLATEVSEGFKMVVTALNFDVLNLQASIDANAEDTKYNIQQLQKNLSDRISKIQDQLNAQFCNFVASCNAGNVVNFAKQGPNFEFEDSYSASDTSRVPLEVPTITIPESVESGGGAEVKPQ
tara:strand:+ start:394 stop:1260 length:867 start_codon:yes stop_codon:yes gene_type:complete